jgi:hypothetical protein
MGLLNRDERMDVRLHKDQEAPHSRLSLGLGWGCFENSRIRRGQPSRYGDSLGRFRQRQLHARRQSHRDEIIGGVQVVFSGFINHPKKSLPGGRRITNHGIELPEFK